MTKERELVTRKEILLAYSILADIGGEKLLNSNHHLDLYQITKDKYDLQKADEYVKEAEVLLEARKILLETAKII